VEYEFESVEVVATSNQWDAPVQIFRNADGTTTIQRDFGPAPKPYVEHFLFPHGVVKIDGVMTPFDLERQPSRYN
jgi:hypothetical protein